MTSTTIPGTTPYRQQEATDYPAGSLRFDWAIILASLWFLAGQFLDGWAHNNLASSLETFFTPWHAVFYVGFFAVASVLVFTQVRNMQRGYPWTHALPNGYWLSLLGVMLFSVGGVGDMIWHTVFGIEAKLSVIPFPFLPFYPEQTIRHYVFHVVYGATQLPMIYVLWTQLRQSW
jgi:hypothetical protein